MRIESLGTLVDLDLVNTLFYDHPLEEPEKNFKDYEFKKMKPIFKK
jgi:hypothetical protein